MGRIGIFGGTFNPPHCGHVHAARAVILQLQLDQLWMIPTHVAPHKQIPEDSPTPQQRLELLRRAAEEIPLCEASDIELRREGNSYTYLTVRQMREIYPQEELVLLMGSDMFLCLQQWKCVEEILENASIGAFYRGNQEEKEAIDREKATLEAKGVKVYLVENPVISISSTQLRRMLIFQCAAPFLQPNVLTYIQEQGFYGTKQDLRSLSVTDLETAALGLLKPNRIAHVQGCRDTAVALAKHWGADETDAARAALLHDVTKALDSQLQLTLCREYGILLDNFSARNPKTLHALTGSLVAQRIFGENHAVVEAIRHHTTGKAGMNLLEKIIYVADYMEPNRDFPGVERLRELAFSDLDAAMILGLEMTLNLLQTQGREVSPESREALEDFRKHAHQKGKMLC